MARLVYSVITSLDGYVADGNGRFDWAAPGADVHRAVNELEAQVGTYLYGRRMYEVMAVWQDLPGLEQASAVEQDYAGIWKSADKIVYSTTLESVPTPRTTLGGGTSCWPSGCRLELDLRSERRFADGTVHLHYRRRR